MSAPRTPYLTQVKSVTETTGTITLTPYDSGVVIIGNTATMNVTLPPAASCNGVQYQFIKTTTNAAAITVDGNASETINGATSYASMDAQYDSVEIVCNGSAWFVVDAKIS